MFVEKVYNYSKKELHAKQLDQKQSTNRVRFLLSTQFLLSTPLKNCVQRGEEEDSHGESKIY
jgi:hypothetical protein